MTRTVHRNRAFSLIELVIVVVIIGIIAAIAIPRMGRGAEGANDNTLVGNLAVLRKAIELYSAEHEGNFPTVADFEEMLTKKTDITGKHNGDDTKDLYGPYLREIPKLNVGTDMAKRTNIVDTGDKGTNGWDYDPATGEIRPNTGTDADKAGTKYADY